MKNSCIKIKYLALLFSIYATTLAQDWTTKYEKVHQVETRNLYRVSLNEKIGFVNGDGNEIIPLKYDYVEDIYHEKRHNKFPIKHLKDTINYKIKSPRIKYFITHLEDKTGNKKGIIDITGTEIIPPKYDYIDKREDYQGDIYFLVRLNHKEGIIDTMGVDITPLKYDKILTENRHNLAEVKLNNKSGVINTLIGEIIPPKYDTVLIRLDGIAVKLNEKVGLVNDRGEEILPLNYDEIEIETNGQYKVSVNGKWGVVDKTNNIIVPCEYDEILFYADCLKIKSDGLWGVFDYTGKEITSRRYKEIGGSFKSHSHIYDFDKEKEKDNLYENFHERNITDESFRLFNKGYVKVTDSQGHNGIINKEGREIVPVIFSDVSAFSEGLAWGFDYDKDEYQWFNENGKKIFSVSASEYIEPESFSDGLIKMVSYTTMKQVFFEKKGKKVFALNDEYQYAHAFSEGLALVKSYEGKYGYINKKGKEVIKPQFDEAESFKEDLALVKHSGEKFFIDKKGKKVFSANYDIVHSFSQGLARVMRIAFQTDDGPYRAWGFINKKGEVVVPLVYWGANDFSEGLAAVNIGRWGWGYIDKKNTVVIGFEFDKAGNFSEGMALVSLYYSWEYIDKKREKIWSGISFDFKD